MAVTAITKDRVDDLTGGQVRVFCTITFSDKPMQKADVIVPYSATDADIVAALRSKVREDAGTMVQTGPIDLAAPVVPPAVVQRNAWLDGRRKLGALLSLKDDLTAAGQAIPGGLTTTIANTGSTLIANFQAAYLDSL